MASNRKEIESKYTNYLEFKNGFHISQDMLDGLLDLAKSKGVELNRDSFEKDREFLVTSLKAQIARDIWGNEGYYALFMYSDEQVTKAVSLFEFAVKLVKGSN